MKTTVQENMSMLVQLVFNNTNAEFARFLNISPQQLNNYISGKHGIGNVMRKRLKKAGINPEWVENSTGSIFTDTPEGKILKNKIVDLDKLDKLENSDYIINSDTIAVNISKIKEASIKVQFKFTSFDLKNNTSYNDLSEVLSATNIISEDPESSYLMTVTGRGMESFGIMKNDSIIVNTKLKPQNNSIVVVFLDGVYIVRSWVEKGDGIFLESSNDIKVIEYLETDKFYFFGVVESVFRKIN